MHVLVILYRFVAFERNLLGTLSCFWLSPLAQWRITFDGAFCVFC